MTQSIDHSFRSLTVRNRKRKIDVRRTLKSNRGGVFYMSRSENMFRREVNEKLFPLLNRKGIFPDKYALEKNGILFSVSQKSSWLQKRKSYINEYLKA